MYSRKTKTHKILERVGRDLKDPPVPPPATGTYLDPKQQGDGQDSLSTSCSTEGKRDSSQSL